MAKNTMLGRARFAGAATLAAALGFGSLVAGPAANADEIDWSLIQPASTLNNDIDWLIWGTHGDTFTGGTKTTVRQINATTSVETTCTIDNVANGASGVPGIVGKNDMKIYQPASWGARRSYAADKWPGDGFPMLYGLQSNAAGETGVGILSGNNTVSSFDITCDAVLKQSGKADVPVAAPGIVFANAESMKNAQPTRNASEYIEVSTVEKADAEAPAQYRFLDTYYDAAPVRADWEKPDQVLNEDYATVSGSSLRISALNNYENRRRAETFLAENTKKLHVSIAGIGQTAIAFGTMASFDFGDAPESYGLAGAVVPALVGGVLADGTYTVASANGPSATTATRSTANTETLPYLGNFREIEAEPVYSAAADAATDDDGFSGAFLTLNYPAAVDADGTLSTDVACFGPGKVQGWIDFNANGTFDANEAAAEAACSDAGTATLNYTVAPGVKAQKTAFMRIRISGVGGAAATGVTATGEVEDYALPLLVTRDSVTTGLQGAEQKADDKAAEDLGKTIEEMFPGLAALATPAYSFEGGATELEIADQGKFVIDPATGEITFTPVKTFVGTATTVKVFAKATISGQEVELVANYTPIVKATPVRVLPGKKLDNVIGSTVSVKPVYAVAGATTDQPGVDLATVTFDEIALQNAKLANAVLSANGKKLAVPGEGVWTISEDGTFTFTPESGFKGDPTPVSYSAYDTNGAKVVNSALITVTYLKPGVVKPAAVKITPKLAETGSTAMPLLFGGAALLVAAAAAMVLGRRSRNS